MIDNNCNLKLNPIIDDNIKLYLKWLIIVQITHYVDKTNWVISFANSVPHSPNDINSPLTKNRRFAIPHPLQALEPRTDILSAKNAQILFYSCSITTALNH